MFTGNSLLPFLDIELFGLPVNLLELVCLGIDLLALHLMRHNRPFQCHDTQIMTRSRLHNDNIAHLYALTRRVAIYAFARILETHLEIILILLLAYSFQPVIHLKLAAALTIGTVHLAIAGMLHHATSRAVILS